MRMTWCLVMKCGEYKEMFVEGVYSVSSLLDWWCPARRGGTMIEILKFIQTFQPSHDQTVAGPWLHMASLESNIKENVLASCYS